MKDIGFMGLFLVLMACQPPQTKDPQQAQIIPKHHSQQMKKIFDAHGGYDQWQAMRWMQFQLANGEVHMVSLQDRTDKVIGTTRSLGFDGKQLWIYPDSLDINTARFRHNLYFYFAAMPFVVGDKGAYYENAGERVIDGKKYNGVKVTFQEGVGDSDQDSYILWSDPSTGKMGWLMYTATFGEEAPQGAQYSLVQYTDWKAVNGLLMPMKIQWHHFDGVSVGPVRGEATFNDLLLSREIPADADSLLKIPEGARTQME